MDKLLPPEINYDTALYALQENVVLKQRISEHGTLVDKLNSNHSAQMICSNIKLEREIAHREAHQEFADNWYKEVQTLKDKNNTLYKCVGAFFALAALSTLSLILLTIFKG